VSVPICDASLVLISILLLALVIGVSALVIVREMQARRREAAVLALMATLAPAVARAVEDPRELLAWYPVAEGARRLFPEAVASLDRATGRRFPFGPEQVQAAHARWTADWLAWERQHDFEYKLKAAAAEDEVEHAGTSAAAAARARLESVERQKLELYQERYEEYVRISKALAALEAAEGRHGG
jgi:hypothetical protein